MISKKDLNKLNRLALLYTAANLEKDNAEKAIVDILGWDFTDYFGSFDDNKSTTETPQNPLLLGYLTHLFSQERGPLAESFHHHLFSQSYSHDKEHPIHALRDADKALRDDVSKHDSVREGDFQTLCFKADYWQTVYRFKDNKYYLGQRPPVESPLTEAQSEEILAQNKRFIHAYYGQKKIEDQIEPIVWHYGLRDKEGYNQIVTWMREKEVSLFLWGFHELRDHWSGELVKTEEEPEGSTKTEEEMQEWRNHKKPMPKKLVLGTKNVSPKNAPAGTYLKDQDCGCIHKVMSDSEVTAMCLRRGSGLNSAYTCCEPYMRLVKPGELCLQKIKCRKDRYKLGSHSRTVGSAAWSFDENFTVVEKPEKFDTYATVNSHPELETEYGR